MPGTARGLSTPRSQRPASVPPAFDAHGASALRPANGSADHQRYLPSAAHDDQVLWPIHVPRHECIPEARPSNKYLR